MINGEMNAKLYLVIETMLMKADSVEVKRERGNYKVLVKYDDGAVEVFNGPRLNVALERMARKHTTIFDK